MATFSEALKEHYLNRPQMPAVQLLQAGKPDQEVSYQELIHASMGYVKAYQADGIQAGEVVVLILEHGVDLLSAYFGAVLQGAIPAIMPFLTEKLLPERYRADLAALVAVTQPAAIVTYPDFEAEVRAALKPGQDSVRAVIVSDNSHPPCPPDFDTLEGLNRKPEDIAILQHSSGTTGLQKGVALSHQAVFNQLESYRRAIRLRDDDVFVSWLPLYHDMGLIACFLMPILLGIPLVLMSPFDWVRAPYRLLRAVSDHGGTLSWLPNFAYNFCAQKIRDRDLDGVDLASWRGVINCSEPMRWESHQAFYERFKGYGLRYQALQTCYAMAENVFAVTQGGVDQAVVVEEIDRESLQNDRIARPTNAEDRKVKMLSAGKAIANTSIRILDGQGNELPDRHIGEVAIKSNCMLTGYYHRPQETAKAFLDGWYLSGDLGYLSEAGELFITGRKKDLIIVGGKNIHPQDIELLAFEVPGIHPGRAVAFGVYNDSLGTEDVVVVAEVESGAEQERLKIGDQLRQTVSRGSAIALRYIHLVDSNWLVKTSSGKTARSANKEKFLDEMKAKGIAY
ncbi:MAG: AMP-binding protein [Chloroflexota bacterium]